MILLYGASAMYHSVNLAGKSLRIFQKLDHMMIFVLIAGSYTPVCLVVLGGAVGYKLLALVWGIALTGMVVKAVKLRPSDVTPAFTKSGTAAKTASIMPMK